MSDETTLRWKFQDIFLGYFDKIKSDLDDKMKEKIKLQLVQDNKSYRIHKKNIIFLYQQKNYPGDFKIKSPKFDAENPYSLTIFTMSLFQNYFFFKKKVFPKQMYQNKSLVLKGLILYLGYLLTLNLNFNILSYFYWRYKIFQFAKETYLETKNIIDENKYFMRYKR